jgi:hypothetical protein
MAENLWAKLLEDLTAAGADVLLEKADTPGYVLALAAREVVDDDDLVAADEEVFGHVRSDKPGATG